MVEGNGNLHVVIDGIICAGTEQHHLRTRRKNEKRKRKKEGASQIGYGAMSKLNLVTLKWEFMKELVVVDEEPDACMR